MVKRLLFGVIGMMLFFPALPQDELVSIKQIPNGS
jgi:hypothetical protein